MINDPNRSGVSDYKQYPDDDEGGYSDDEFDPEPAKQYPAQTVAAPPMMVKKGYPPSPEAVSAPRSAGYAPSYPAQSPNYPSQSPGYAEAPPVSRYANVPGGSQENIADPSSGRFVTGSSHQLAPGQTIELNAEAGPTADTFV